MLSIGYVSTPSRPGSSRRVVVGAAAHRHRRDHRRASSSGTLMTRFLPFARPEIDEETIAAVGRGAALGLVLRRPAGAALRKRAFAYFGRRPYAPSPTPPPRSRRRSGSRRRTGDEVIVPAMTFVASANVVVLAGAARSWWDVDSTAAIPMRRASRPRSRRAPGRSWPCISPAAGGLGADFTRSGPPRAARDRGRGARHGSGLPRPAVVRAGATLVASASTRTRTSPPCEGGALSFRDPGEVERAERLRFHGIPSLRERHGRARARGANRTLPTFSGEHRHRQLAKLERFKRGAPRSRGGISRNSAASRRLRLPAARHAAMLASVRAPHRLQRPG